MNKPRTDHAGKHAFNLPLVSDELRELIFVRCLDKLGQKHRSAVMLIRGEVLSLQDQMTRQSEES